jgi:hypothetical protein
LFHRRKIGKLDLCQLEEMGVIRLQVAGLLVLNAGAGCKKWYIAVLEVLLGRKMKAGALVGGTRLHVYRKRITEKFLSTPGRAGTKSPNLIRYILCIALT